MAVTKAYPEVRAVHHDGVLELLDALDLPEGARVRLSIVPVQPVGAGESPLAGLVYPCADYLARPPGFHVLKSSVSGIMQCNRQCCAVDELSSQHRRHPLLRQEGPRMLDDSRYRRCPTRSREYNG